MREFHLMQHNGRTVIDEKLMAGAQVIRSVKAASWKEAKAILIEVIFSE